MRRSVNALTLVLLACFYCSAQQVASSTRPDASNANTGSGVDSSPEERRIQIDYLQKALGALRDYLSTLSAGSEDYKRAERTIQELDSKLQQLVEAKALSTAPRTSVNIIAASVSQSTPEFSLAVPRKGRTNISSETSLTWTEDRSNGTFQDPSAYNLKRFRLVIAKDEGLKDVVHEEPSVTPPSAKVTPNATAPKGLQSIAASFTVPANTLEPGTKYYWQVFAVYTPQGQPDTIELEKRADNGPYYFITALDPFHPLTKRNFSLQRTVDSTDPTEGAQFSFLKTFGGKTVFSTDFAFFWDSPSKRFANNRGFIWFRPAVEAKLTSDTSTSEDALKFSGSAVVDYNFIDLDTNQHNRLQTGTSVSAPRKFIDGLYFEFGGSLEGDQKFQTKKLTSRFYVSPSSRLLAIGTATGQIESPVQFMWRPSFEFNAGHTLDKGNSNETGKTVLRLVPKVRLTLYTRGLSRLLKIANSDFYVDNTFYYLPKDNLKKQHDFFTSGFELLFMKNFGFGLTYKNGESAPKFTRVNTFGGVLTVRFGPE
jgi:hypothetical protein